VSQKDRIKIWLKGFEAMMKLEGINDLRIN